MPVYFPLGSGGGGGGAVASVSGDGTLINNASSTGSIALTLGNAPANSVWGNNTAGSAVPAYQTSLSISGALSAASLSLTSPVSVSNGGSGGTGSVNAQSSNYTLALSDAGSTVELNSASAITATIPPNASVAFPIGTQVNIMQYGAGAASLVAGAGVTLRYLSTLNLSGQYALVTAVKIATNEWKIVGELQ